MHAILIEPAKALFIIVPKAASSSIVSAILEMMDGRPFTGAIHGERRKRGLQIEGDQIKDYEGWLRFAVARNPWARLVSCFREKIGRRSRIFRQFEHYGWRAGMAFDTFVRDVVAMPDHKRNGHFSLQLGLMTHRNEFCVDVLMHLEQLDSDWPALQKRLPQLPDLRRSGWIGPATDYHEWYDAELWGLVRGAFAEDIERFSYANDHL